MNTNPSPNFDLWHFLIDLATNPLRQAAMTELTPEELQQVLINEGMSEEEALLLANAQGGSAGRQQLVDYLGGRFDYWHSGGHSGNDGNNDEI